MAPQHSYRLADKLGVDNLSSGGGGGVTPICWDTGCAIILEYFLG